MQGVYVQTNDANGNEVVAFARREDGTLEPYGRSATGGGGSGAPHLPSQGSVVVADEYVLVANAGSDDVSVLELDGLELVQVVPSGGSAPRSIGAHGELVYVLNTAEPNVTGFRFAGGRLEPIGVSQPAGTDPAQVAFAPDGRTLVVTDRADAIHLYAVDGDGRAAAPRTFASAGATPYGFAFAADGTLIVTEAARAEIGAASASSYRLEDDVLRPVSEAVGDLRSEVCWAVVAGRHAYVTNFGDGTISRYEIGADGSIVLRDPVAATTVADAKGVRDEALSADGRFLYTLDADARAVFAFRVEGDGSLSRLGAINSLPATAAGIAAV